MALKTDFKDDIFEGNRKYKLSRMVREILRFRM